MLQNAKHIEHLVHKFNTGQINHDELQTLLDWYNGHDDQKVTLLSKDGSGEDVKSRMLAGLLAKITDKEAGPTKPPVRWYRWATWVSVAAAVTLVTLGTWIILRERPARDLEFVKTSIEPGGNKATLTLADGREIELSTTQSEIITGEKTTYANGIPVENSDAIQPGDAQKLLALHTPRGGTYKITLPDGTQVWLNAATTIKYPLRFDADERIVELVGEAYFHVKPAYRKNGEKIPFKVLSNRQEIEVLGTQFNISAYPDQQSTKTTLVEGKVAVRGKQGRFILSPNEQAVTTGKETSVGVVDVYVYTAWRDGKFSFDGKTFEETMNEIGRWYDLDIVYEKGIPNEELVGDAFRNQNINLVLRLMDVAEIDYKLDVGRRVLIIKGKKNRM